MNRLFLLKPLYVSGASATHPTGLDSGQRLTIGRKMKVSPLTGIPGKTLIETVTISEVKSTSETR